MNGLEVLNLESLKCGAVHEFQRIPEFGATGPQCMLVIFHSGRRLSVGQERISKILPGGLDNCLRHGRDPNAKNSCSLWNSRQLTISSVLCSVRKVETRGRTADRPAAIWQERSSSKKVLPNNSCKTPVCSRTSRQHKDEYCSRKQS